MKRIVLAGLASLIAPAAEAAQPTAAVPMVRQIQGAVPVSQLVQGATKKAGGGATKKSMSGPREDKVAPEIKDSAAKREMKFSPGEGKVAPGKAAAAKKAPVAR
jgi:hypothetical protein